MVMVMQILSRQQLMAIIAVIGRSYVIFGGPGIGSSGLLLLSA